ncbi:glycoside hydrolase family 31 protein [Hymenobacter sp. H14-R3]|uniref:TIM-barrel domain-containing protein n=1 Tax=Hymenobacter sp. H14-R3 TaxID=3046308 RepID=UPI0024BABD11|nr:TIM-barrel domain-containing protein [Hymenobacter sp. H14-R3]MDJ0364130.1 glycoside hydrolase family 31 protein [Hymenobacter sp. H14-R3]
MLSPFLYRAGWLLPAVLLLATPAHAQQVGDRPPTQDPFGRRPVRAREVPGGRYESHSFDTEKGLLTIQATDGSSRQIQEWGTGVVKINYFAPGRQPVADSSLSVLNNNTLPHTDGVTVRAPDGKHVVLLANPSSATATTVRLRTNHGIIIIQKSSLQVSWEYGSDILFSEAAAPFRRQPRTAQLPPRPDSQRPGYAADEGVGTGVRFRLAPGERLYGTGARALPLDRRGYRLELYNQAHYGYQNGEQNLNVTLPVVLSSRGYLLLFDHYAPAYLDLGQQQPDALEYGARGLNSLSYFVVTGRDQGEILNRYTALTGRQPLPPRWALGLIQSRFGYRSQAQMLAVAARMRRENFPLDALVLDLFWFGGTTRQGDFAWDAANFPDPAGMMHDLKAQGVHTILISEPYVMRTSLNDSLVRTQGLVGTTAAGRPFTVGSFWAGPASILDVFKPQAHTWLWAQYQRLHDQGAAGWWSDLGEPENHPLAMHHALGPAAQVHNAYGMTWAQILQDNYARTYPDERLFNLARSGWAGMQRNSVFPWSGDINRSWNGLQAQVPIMLGMGQAGVGYMHSDAGGFGANATQDPELYTRWLQLAALCPIMRPHSDQVVAPEPYTYPEPYRSIVRRYAHLRYELLPYLYTLAAQNTLTGAPLARAMDFTSKEEWGLRKEELDGGDWGVPASPASASSPSSVEEGGGKTALTPAPTADLAPPGDQYLLGPNLLVAPINQPGQRRRNVVLPATPGGWVDWETGQTLPGGQTVGLNAPLEHIPLLARAGAIVPMTAYRASTTAYRPDTLVVRYFPDPSVSTSVFTMYEDDGHAAQALKQQQFATIELTASTTDDYTTFTAVASGKYPGAPSQRLVQLRIARVASAPVAVQLAGQPLAATEWHYDAVRHELQLQFPLAQRASVSVANLRLLTEPAMQLDPETLTLTAPDSRTFTGSAGLHYERYVAADSPAPLRIRNARGQVVRELPTQAAAGIHALSWDGRDAQGQLLTPGVYEVELAGQHQQLVRMP